MQMTDDPSPLPRTPSRGFRDKPQRNYNAFARHAPVFSTNVNDVREALAGTDFDARKITRADGKPDAVINTVETPYRMGQCHREHD